MVIRYGDSKPFIRNVFTLNTCAPIVGSRVICFATEAEMLSVTKLLLDPVLFPLNASLLLSSCFNVGSRFLPKCLKRYMNANFLLISFQLRWQLAEICFLAMNSIVFLTLCFYYRDGRTLFEKLIQT